jgi:hypothetical protein
MEGSGAFASRLIIKQVSCRQPRETESNHHPRRTPTAVLVLKTIPGPIAGSLRGPLFLFTSAAPVLQANRAATLTHPTCALQPLACSRKRVKTIVAAPSSL